MPRCVCLNCLTRRSITYNECTGAHTGEKYTVQARFAIAGCAPHRAPSAVTATRPHARAQALSEVPVALTSDSLRVGSITYISEYAVYA